MGNNLFFGGIPTDVDVGKLREKYPETDMQYGDVFPYKDVCDLLGLMKEQHRFRTVTWRWRKIIEVETNHIIGADVDMKSFKVLTETEKAELARRKLRSAGNAARRSYVITARVDRKELTAEQCAQLDQTVITSAKMLTAGQMKKGKVALPTL